MCISSCPLYNSDHTICWQFSAIQSYVYLLFQKRGHENPGLDEPHEARRYHDRNGRGKANFGMDRDADADAYNSRDGSPTMSGSRDGIHHMGMDPMDGSIGTGV